MVSLADESVDRHIVNRLRQDGHAVRYVAEMEPRISDGIVLSLANQGEDILLTADKDFGELAVRERRLASGILPVRLAGFHQRAGQRLLVLLSLNVVQNCQVPSACSRQVLFVLAA